jgi:tetratricopeptide (TPR) repeat protein
VAKPADNPRLRNLLAEASWSRTALANAVNEVSGESGLPLHYSRSSAAQWLTGTRPRPPAPALVAEALSRRLKRPLTAADVGLCDQRRDQGVSIIAGPPAQRPGSIDVTAILIELAGTAPTAAQSSATCVYTLAGLAVPAWEQLSGIASTRPTAGPRVRVGTAEVAAATSMLSLFAEADASFGAGHLRAALATTLATTISTWLRADTEAEPGARTRLLRVAARLAYLCGFMCFDDLRQGEALRYFRSALWLSAEAGDRLGHAIALRAMSVQAHTLNHHTHARHLAEAALDTAGHQAAPRASAFLHGQLAAAYAATGDRRAALTQLHAARHALDHADDTPGPVGGYHPAALAHHQSIVLAHLGDRSGAIAALQQSAQHRPATERRSGAYTLARLAQLQLAHGHLDQAVATWHQVLDEYPAIHSARLRAALAAGRAQLRTHHRNPLARDLMERAAHFA